MVDNIGGGGGKSPDFDLEGVLGPHRCPLFLLHCNKTVHKPLTLKQRGLNIGHWIYTCLVNNNY